jgi:hypothetical protein
MNDTVCMEAGDKTRKKHMKENRACMKGHEHEHDRTDQSRSAGVCNVAS